MDNAYLDWLRRHGERLFEGAGISWRLYRRALIPATAAPCFVEMTPEGARALLTDSRAWLLRYSSDPCVEPTEWWYIVCDRYDPGMLSSKMRTKINRGRRRCTVTRIEPQWLADHGYRCYLAAFARYARVTPVEETAWRERILRSADGPFEHWGVFVGSQLAGYSECVIEGDNVGSNVLKLHPEYLKERSASALVSHLLAFYVGGQGKKMSNGNRSVAHETQFNEFLIEHGFRRQFCRLNVVYRGMLRAAIGLIYPVRRAVLRVSVWQAAEAAKALLVQEEWHRASQRPRY
jgi:hypothetical protein